MGRILFTDLDGTLLHPQTYSAEPARPALEVLKRLGIPVIFCTSKTRPEVELWRRRLENSEPFIVENGGAIYIPHGCFTVPIPGALSRSGYDVIELGSPYSTLIETLKTASVESACEVLGFHQMSVADIAVRTRLPVSQAEMAKRREYDEPFEVLSPWGTHKLLEAIENHGKRWTRGDHFYHVTGNNSKAKAVQQLTAMYRSAFGDVVTIGVGNAHNDKDFLQVVDVPIIIQSQFSAPLKEAVPRAAVSQHRGPQGWNEAVLKAVSVGFAGVAGRSN